MIQKATFGDSLQHWNKVSLARGKFSGDMSVCIRFAIFDLTDHSAKPKTANLMHTSKSPEYFPRAKDISF